jgi:L-alanine-DL-glutamate epimerase-like enolase superfamily enzyme
LKTTVDAVSEAWPLAREFRIARGAKQAADVVVVRVSDGDYVGLGECVPYTRYGESVASTLTQLATANTIDELGPGAARNAWDCALWDLRAQQEGSTVWVLAGLPEPASVDTAYTIGIDSIAAMQAHALANADRPLLKIKLGGPDRHLDGERLRAVRDAVPTAEIIVDVNEGWNIDTLNDVLPVAEEVGVVMIEQPLPADADAALVGFDSPVPIGADESMHTGADLETLKDKYQVVNIKLDKTGGLTHAIDAINLAKSLQFDIMVGCMVATSLSMAPAVLLAPMARFVDLDGPLLLRKDRQPGLEYHNSTITWPKTRLWGQPQNPGRQR